MKSTSKYFIIGVALFVTGSMWGARTATYPVAPTREITKKVVPIRKRSARSLEQPVEKESAAYKQVLSTMQTTQPSSKDFSVLENIKAEAEHQISIVESTSAINESVQGQTQVGGVDQFIPMPSINLGYNIKETKNSVIVTVDVPGLKLSDISVEIDAYNNNNMIVSSEKIKTTDIRGVTTYNISDKSAFFKEFSLPCPVDANKMVKKISNGVLTITLPKE